MILSKSRHGPVHLHHEMWFGQDSIFPETGLQSSPLFQTSERDRDKDGYASSQMRFPSRQNTVVSKRKEAWHSVESSGPPAAKSIFRKTVHISHVDGKG